MNAITALLLASVVRQGWGREIFGVSSDPIIAFEGSDVLFQWNLKGNLTSQPDFKGVVFGIWRNGYLATYLTTVTKNEQVIPNPDLRKEAPQFFGRVQWRGDLSKSLAVFQISAVSSKDQMDYGLLLNFGPYRNSPSDSVSLKVEEMRSMITALPLLLKPTKQDKNVTFHCEFHVDEDDRDLFDGVAVGVWERGEISLTLMTVTSSYNIVINPKLYQEGPEYNQRVYGYLSTNNTNNATRLTVELADVTESGDRSYGCSMYFGPFREPLGSSLSIDVEDSTNNNGLPLETNYTHETSEVRVGKDIYLSCPVLTEVIKLDGTFKALFWSYCTSKTCISDKTTWSWMAGMNRQRITKVTDKDPYRDRLNLTSNGTLELSNVQISDSTDYRCTVQRVNFTSPRYYFVTLVVNATGSGEKIFRLSSDPVRAFQGSNALFQWALKKYLTSRPDFQGVVFGLWRNGYVASYILSVTKTGGIVTNPGLKDEAPSLDGRVQWKGDLSKSIAAFEISHLSALDQMDYGMRLDFGEMKDSESDFLSLRVEEEGKSAITTALSPPLSVTPGKNTSFQCEFHVGEEDKGVYDGVTVGIWERGAIFLTLLTLTTNETIVINPKLDQEVPEYQGRVHAKALSNKTSNTSVMSIEIKDVRESDRRSFGCSMYFGPFKGSLGAYVHIDVKHPRKQYQGQVMQNSFYVRLGEQVQFPCPKLLEVIKREGEFKSVSWKYCSSETCDTDDTKWSWMAAMDNCTGNIKVDDAGPYANRTKMFVNGTLELNDVKASDNTDYKCIVRRKKKYTSPKFHFVTLNVDSRVRPKITSKSKSKVTVHEGNVLFLKCKVEGVPTPFVIWRKDGLVIQNQTKPHTYFMRENATKAEKGEYVCEASNSGGSDSYMVEVKIIPLKGPKEVSKSELGAGAIAGIVVSSVAVVVAVAIVYFCCFRKSRMTFREVFFRGSKGKRAKKSECNANGTFPAEETEKDKMFIGEAEAMV